MAPSQKSGETHPRGTMLGPFASLVSARRATSRTHVCTHGGFPRRVAETRRENGISVKELRAISKVANSIADTACNVATRET